MLDTFNDTPSGIKQIKGFESLSSSSSSPSSASPRQKQNLTMAGHPVFTLHYFPFSLYSLMARFGFVLGEELNPATAPRVEIRFVDRQNTENLSEDYLVNVNPKGSVPSLTSPSLPSALTDSRDISTWLCDKQPELLPEEHKENIVRLVDMLYDFHAMALMISPDDRKDGIPNQAAALLENPDLTEPHRRALEIKSIYHDTFHSHTLDSDNIAEVESKCVAFLDGIATLLQEREGGGDWLFGNRPTILDAHAFPFIRRLMDRNRLDLVTQDAVKAYAEGITKSKEWQRVSHGRRTLYDASYGPARELPL
ncbi:hypothetical protein N3K66_000583 [Trichothecium roseum]|uniref:Uncharacterized protein n=1 Tax=Trichothecium roseum TaxID=47278 RepID=A0ACC0VCN4_9HYPO|nr:hypothetical protein N3K66_000583 [Trichothecium roseum]